MLPPDLLHFVWFTAKPTMRELPHAIGRCSIARHLELNPSRSSVLWIIGEDARPTVAPPLTTTHPRLEVRATTRDEVLSGSARALVGTAHRQLHRRVRSAHASRQHSGSYQDLLRLALINRTAARTSTSTSCRSRRCQPATGCRSSWGTAGCRRDATLQQRRVCHDAGPPVRRRTARGGRPHAALVPIPHVLGDVWAPFVQLLLDPAGVRRSARSRPWRSARRGSATAARLQPDPLESRQELLPRIDSVQRQLARQAAAGTRALHPHVQPRPQSSRARPSWNASRASGCARPRV